MTGEVDPYIREKRLALGRQVLGQTRIYLDTNYWIRLRDTTLGRHVSPEWPELLKLLQVAADDRRIVCPVSPSVFMELLLQRDTRTRSATARIMDRLSAGVAIQSTELQLQAQILHFVHFLNGSDVDRVPWQVYAWTKVGYVLGDVFLNLPGLAADIAKQLTRRVDDRVWTLQLAEVVDRLPGDVPSNAERRTRLATEMNEKMREHATECKSLDELRRAEANGALGALMDHVRSAIDCFSGESEPPWTAPERATAAQTVAAILAQTIVGRKQRERIPALVIPAMLYATIRWDQGRRLMANDILDVEHAGMAMGLCSAMFTDAALAHLLVSQKLDGEFGVVVESDPGAAIEYVSRAMAN